MIFVFSESTNGGEHESVEVMEDKDVVDETTARSNWGWIGIGERKESRHRFSFLPFQKDGMCGGSQGLEIGK